MQLRRSREWEDEPVKRLHSTYVFALEMEHECLEITRATLQDQTKHRFRHDCSQKEALQSGTSKN